MGTGRGSGKIIILGEHFVVYGSSAIAAGTSSGIQVKVAKSEKDRVESNGYTRNALKALKRIKEYFEIFDGIEISGIQSELPMGAGMGSSAALFVAIARAINNEFNLNESDTEICNAAFCSEKIFHGNPSGIDNTVATFGGLIRFKKGVKAGEPNLIEMIETKKSILLLVVHSGKIGITKEQVEKVSKFRKANPGQFQSLLISIEKMVQKAEQSIVEDDLKSLGEVMNVSQDFLSTLGTSSKELDEIVGLCRASNALGAKLSGAGGGGCAISLFERQEDASHAKEALKRKGYDSFESVIQSTRLSL